MPDDTSDVSAALQLFESGRWTWDKARRFPTVSLLVALNLAKDPEVKSAIALHLGHRADEAAVHGLSALLSNPSSRVCCEAADALESIGSPLCESALIERLLVEPDEQVIESLIHAAASCDVDASVPILVQFLREHPARRVRTAAADALSELQAAEALPAVTERIRAEPDPDLRVQLVHLERQLAEPPPIGFAGRAWFVPEGIATVGRWTIEHPNGLTTCIADGGLVIGHDNRPGTTEVSDGERPSRLLRDIAATPHRTRKLSYWCNEYSVADISAALGETGDEVELQVLCRVLRLMGQPEIPGPPPMQPLLRHPSSRVRAAAAEAFLDWWCDNERPFGEVLTVAESERDSRVRAVFTRWFGNYLLGVRPASGRDASGLIASLLRSTDPAERLVAAESLAIMRASWHVDDLASAAAVEQHPDVRRWLTRTIDILASQTE